MNGNQQRAAEVCHLLDISGGARDVKEAVVSVALDEAEARGRAEVAEKVEALAEELGGWGDTAPSHQQVWLADRLRAALGPQ